MASTKDTAQNIIDNLGGPDNVDSLTHCATRLRFQLHDTSQIDEAALDRDPAVLGTVHQGEHGYQVVMGGGVAEYYNEIIKIPGVDASGEDRAKRSEKKDYQGVRGKYGWVDYGFEFLSDTFRPILWPLLGASLIIMLLVVADTLGIQDFRADVATQPPLFQLAHAMYQSVFYFLPIFVGATAAQKLGANMWVSAAIPAALLTSEFMGMGERGDVLDVGGLPLVMNEYGGQVFPPILAAIGLYFVEKGLKKIIPNAVHMVFVPFFSLLIMIPATAFLLGPFGIGVGNAISAALYAINDFSPFVLAIVIPLLYPFLVPMGLHWPLNVIMIQNIAVYGYDFIQGPMGAWNFACFGVVAGVLIISLREKNQPMTQVGVGALAAGLFGGISEPSLYGILLRFRRSYYRLLPGCALGGVVMGLFDVKANAFVFTSALTINAFDPWGGYAIGVLVAFGTSLLLTIFFGYRTPEEKAEAQRLIAEQQRDDDRDDETVESAGSPANAAADTAERGDAAGAAAEGVGVERTAAESSTATSAATASAAAGAASGTQASTATLERQDPSAADNAEGVIALTSPVEGHAVPLAQVPDPIFAGAKLGEGVAVQPTGTEVVAPVAGKVLTIQKSGHAVGLKLDNGVQLLIHVGLDTVELGGEGFQVHVEKKQRVAAGDKLITFDPQFITERGYNLITPVVVTNSAKFSGVDAHEGEATAASTLLEIHT